MNFFALKPNGLYGKRRKLSLLFLSCILVLNGGVESTGIAPISIFTQDMEGLDFHGNFDIHSSVMPPMQGLSVVASPRQLTTVVNYESELIDSVD